MGGDVSSKFEPAAEPFKFLAPPDLHLKSCFSVTGINANNQQAGVNSSDSSIRLSITVPVTHFPVIGLLTIFRHPGA